MGARDVAVWRYSHCVVLVEVFKFVFELPGLAPMDEDSYWSAEDAEDMMWFESSVFSDEPRNLPSRHH